MENVFVALVCIAVLIVGSTTIALNSFNSIDKLAYALKDSESLANDMRHTIFSSVSSNTNGEGTVVEIVIRNDGQTSLGTFRKWDVIIRHQSGLVQWLPYTTATPGWTVGGLYLDGKPEIYEPNMFNPMETMKLVLKLAPPAADKSTNLAIISAPNGIGVETTFTRK